MKALVQRAWHSPTITAWTNRVAQSARLIILLPLVLREFDDVQVSSWLLFSSTLFFVQIISQQTALVISRMIALASGGASDLSPHTGKTRQTLGIANWPLIERLYATQQSLNVILSVFGLLLAALIGYYSLENLLAEYAGAREVWIAFGIFVAGNCVYELQRKYEVTLKGLGQVALTNRWNALFSILSSCGGAATLALGGSIVELAIVMQVFMLIGIARQWMLLMFVVEPRFRTFRTWGWDRQILHWGWQPLWRGMVQMLANRGGSKIAAIVLARNLDSSPAALASILLVLRLLDMLEDISTVPISSNSPRLARRLGEGNIASFRKGIERAFRLANAVHVAGIIALACLGNFALGLINSETALPPVSWLFAIGIAQTLFSAIRKSLMISIIGNHVVVVERFIIAALLTVGLAFWLIPVHPFWGVVASSYLPVILIVNIKPLQIGCALMQESVLRFAMRTMIVPFAVLLLVAVVAARIIS